MKKDKIITIAIAVFFSFSFLHAEKNENRDNYHAAAVGSVTKQDTNKQLQKNLSLKMNFDQKFSGQNSISRKPRKSTKSFAFKALTLSNIAFSLGDVTTTRIAFTRKGFKELNPIANMYVKSPTLHVALSCGVLYLQTKLMNTIYKKNKTLAYVGYGVMVLVRGLIVFNNMNELL